MSDERALRKNIEDRMNSKCKSPEAEAGSACETSKVAGAV